MLSLSSFVSLKKVGALLVKSKRRSYERSEERKGMDARKAHVKRTAKGMESRAARNLGEYHESFVAVCVICRLACVVLTVYSQQARPY